MELCREFGCLPSQIRAEGADVIRMMRLVDYAKGVTVDGR